MITAAARRKWANTERQIQENEKDYAYFKEHGQLPFYRIHKPRMNSLFERFGKQGVGFFNVCENMGFEIPISDGIANHVESNAIPYVEGAGVEPLFKILNT
jgi:hypothetical protein